jgi:hypothetical protein
MILTYRLEKLISQAPQGLKFNMTAGQLATYNTMEAGKNIFVMFTFSCIKTRFIHKQALLHFESTFIYSIILISTIYYSFNQ